jgi:hypothetical protein
VAVTGVRTDHEAARVAETPESTPHSAARLAVTSWLTFHVALQDRWSPVRTVHDAALVAAGTAVLVSQDAARVAETCASTRHVVLRLALTKARSPATFHVVVRVTVSPVRVVQVVTRLTLTGVRTVQDVARVAVTGWKTLHVAFQDRWIPLRVDQDAALRTGVTALLVSQEDARVAATPASVAQLVARVVLTGVDVPATFHVVARVAGVTAARAVHVVARVALTPACVAHVVAREAGVTAARAVQVVDFVCCTMAFAAHVVDFVCCTTAFVFQVVARVVLTGVVLAPALCTSTTTMENGPVPLPPTPYPTEVRVVCSSSSLAYRVYRPVTRRLSGIADGPGLEDECVVGVGTLVWTALAAQSPTAQTSAEPDWLTVYAHVRDEPADIADRATVGCTAFRKTVTKFSK